MKTSIITDADYICVLIEDVELFVNVEWQDDSFDYAGTHCTGGLGGTHKLPIYASIEEDIQWDRSKYSDAENQTISDYVRENKEDLEEQLIAKFEQEQKDDHDY